jgi:hypothetical protein
MKEPIRIQPDNICFVKMDRLVIHTIAKPQKFDRTKPKSCLIGLGTELLRGRKTNAK